MATPPMLRLQIARCCRFIREAPGYRNTGRWVGILQRVTGNGPGDAWCASFVAFVLALAYQGKPPLPATGGCQELLTYARAHGLVTTTPQPGDVYLLLNDQGHAHHTGFVTALVGTTHFAELSGNTNDDGSRDGYGVFERTGDQARMITAAVVFVRLPAEPKAPNA